MTLLLTMLPFYLFGNLHCLGMCGPLVMAIGHQRYRYFYFLGRTLSFTLAGMIAGGIGAVIHLFLDRYHIPALTSVLFGGLIFFLGCLTFVNLPYPGYQWLSKQTARTHPWIASLILHDRIWPSFLFGFLTILLPCGQTLVVFSACALSGSLFIGMINGIAFALLTSPSLILAMKAHYLIGRLKKHSNTMMGLGAMMIGFLSCLRGFADLGWIPHLVLTPEDFSFHLVVY